MCELLGGLVVVCILCLKFGIQTAIVVRVVCVGLLQILAGLVRFTSSLVTCRKQYNNICDVDLLHILAGLVGLTSSLATCRKQCNIHTQAWLVNGRVSGWLGGHRVRPHDEQ